MGIFADPATACLSEDPVLAEFATDIIEDEATSPARSSRFGKKGFRRSNSLDSSPVPRESTLSPKRSGRRIRKVTRTQSGKTRPSMKEHLEDIEAFCEVVKSADSEQRSRILEKSMKRHSSKAGRTSPIPASA